MLEGVADIHDAVSRVGLPDLSDHGLEGVQVGVKCGIEFPLDDALPEIIQRIEVWG